MLRLVTADLGPTAAPVAFHSRLTVLVGATGRGSARCIADGSRVTIARQDDAPVAIEDSPAGGGPAVVRAHGLQELLTATTRLASEQLATHAREVQRSIARARRDEAARAEPRLVGTDGEADTLAEELLAIEEQLLHRRSRDVVRRELRKWERVVEEARVRLADQREYAAPLAPSDLAEAGRLRSEWRYAEQVHRQLRRRRTRREMDGQRSRYEEFLTQFGATCYEDLTVVGTGFGNTEADLAIREAATVLSMAEQQSVALREELAAFDNDLGARRAAALARAGKLLGRAPGFDAIAELRALPTPRTAVVAIAERDRFVELQRLEREAVRLERAAEVLARPDRTQLDRLGPAAIESLLDHALALGDDDLVTPALLDCALDGISARARRRALTTVVAHSEQRQIVLVTERDDIVTWASILPADAAAVIDRR
ncbi:MAG: hypothetical protein ACT4OX_04635 [Actinomycetota bacterium]